MRTQNALDAVDVCRLLNKAVKSAGGQAAFIAKAKACGIEISPQLLSVSLSGSRAPSDRVLKAANIRRVVTTHYEIVEKNYAA